jgi:hypothetical protein
LKAIIEAQGIEETILEKELKKIEESLRKEKGFTIYDIALAKTVKSGEHYSSYLDVSLSVKDFRSLVRLMFFYGPVSVEVIKPEKLELTADDLQDAIVDMGEMIQSYNNYIMKSMKKEEIEKFNQKMYKQAAKAE